MSAGAANISALIDKTGTYLDTGAGPTTAQTLRVSLPNDAVIQVSGPLTLDTDAHLENPIPVMIPGDVTNNLTRVNGNLISLGQTTSANSLPVVLPSDYTLSLSGSFGRTWTLASGTDSVAAVQSGTWTVQQGGAPWSENITQFGGSAVVTGTGAGGAGIPRVTVSNDSNILATQSGTWTVQQGSAPWSENITQFGGIAISTGTGASGTGIPRVTVSNDSNVLATQSGTWTVQQGGAPWSQNVTQFGSSAVVTGTGTGGAGIPRVTISNDSSLAANQSTNVNQFGGSAVATGTGTGGAGIPRVTVSSDSSLTSVGSITNALPSGTNLMGKVGIDQTTPGTTNGVVSTTQDVLVTGSLLAQDTASTVVTGQSGSSVITGSATASSTVATTMSGVSDVTVRIAGTWAGTIQLEVSADNGTTWGIASLIVVGTNSVLSSLSQNGTFIANTSGATNFRARAVTLLAGTPTVAINKTQTSGVVYIGNQTTGQALESGGNLDIHTALMKNQAQLVELGMMQVGLLRAIYLMLASMSGGPEIALDNIFAEVTIQ